METDIGSKTQDVLVHRLPEGASLCGNCSL